MSTSVSVQCTVSGKPVDFICCFVLPLQNVHCSSTTPSLTSASGSLSPTGVHSPSGSTQTAIYGFVPSSTRSMTLTRPSTSPTTPSRKTRRMGHGHPSCLLTTCGHTKISRHISGSSVSLSTFRSLIDYHVKLVWLTCYWVTLWFEYLLTAGGYITLLFI